MHRHALHPFYPPKECSECGTSCLTVHVCDPFELFKGRQEENTVCLYSIYGMVKLSGM